MKHQTFSKQFKSVKIELIQEIFSRTCICVGLFFGRRVVELVDLALFAFEHAESILETNLEETIHGRAQVEHGRDELLGELGVEETYL